MFVVIWFDGETNEISVIGTFGSSKEATNFALDRTFDYIGSFLVKEVKPI